MAVQERIDGGLPPLSDREGWLRKKRDGGIEVSHCGADFVHGMGFGPKRDYSDFSVILLTRDMRDTLVSGYFHMTRRGPDFDGSLSDYIRSSVGLVRLLDFYGRWDKHRFECFDFIEWRYEDLFLRSFGMLKDLFGWMRVDIQDNVILQAIEECSFENLNRKERDGFWKDFAPLRPYDVKDAESYKFRRGVVGGYKDYLSNGDIAYIEEVVGKWQS